MSLPQQQWLLKVIGGPHQGAEIGLYAGKTLVGSDDECDVVLHDVLVAPQHVELDLSTTGIIAAPLGGRVFINGKRVREARQPLPAFAFLSIGGSHLVLGPAGQTWPLLSAADLPDLEKESEADPKAVESTPVTSLTTGETTESTLKPIASEGKITSESPDISRSASRAGPVLGIVAGIILLVGWVVVYKDFFAEGGKTKPAKGGQISENHDADLPITRVEAVIKELGLVDSILVEEAAGRLTASGYVDTESKQRELQAALRATVPGLRTKIYSLEKIASTARSLIEAQRLPLTASSLSEGKLRISGKLTSADPWIRMKQTLLAEVPGLSEVQDDVEIEAPQPPAPNKLFISRVPVIENSSVSPPVITPVPSPVIAPSAPTQPVMVPEHATEGLITQDTIDTPEATIASIRPSGEGLGYIRLNTGGVYFTGARLPYGGTIDKIEADSVTIIERGQTRKLQQGDVAMKDKTPVAP